MTGRALRSIRLALSLSVHDFSARIGIPAKELDDYERGDTAVDADRLSIALERLVPDVKRLGDDPLFLPTTSDHHTRGM